MPPEIAGEWIEKAEEDYGFACAAMASCGPLSANGNGVRFSLDRTLRVAYAGPGIGGAGYGPRQTS